MIPDNKEMFTMKSKKSNYYYFTFSEEVDDDTYVMISAETYYTGMRDIFNLMPYYKIMLNYIFNKNIYCFCDANKAFAYYTKVTEIV
jgi:hypothetical protein